MQAQINLKVGYTGSYAEMEIADQIFDRINANSPDRTKDLGNIRIRHGMELGLRYTIGVFAIDAGVSSMTGSTDGENLTLSTGVIGNAMYRSSLTNYFVGLENQFGFFGYGGNIGYLNLKYKTDINGGSDLTTIYNERILASKFYLNLEAKGDGIAFAIRPYVMVPWEPYNLEAVESNYNENITMPSSNYSQESMIFGISVLFFNGPQKK